MRISELSQASGVSIATIKFYIREGMLPRGRATSATTATYSDEHLKRIRLIVALSDVRALPLSQVKEILSLVDAPLHDPSETLSRVIGALPPYADDADDYPRAMHAIDVLGFNANPTSAAVKQLETAIQAVLDAELFWSDDDIRFYGDIAMRIAQREAAPMMALEPRERIAFAVLGTAMYEPIILAMRRLAHQNLHRTATASPEQQSAPREQ